MTKYLQDIRFAARQLRKAPAFTLTMLGTLALGIGANAAIFTLVNAVLLKNLPVADPKTLIRVGDTGACCVSGGLPPSGDVSLFSTESYEQMKKNAPDFEELAAMQAGFGYRPVTVRRDGDGNLARSVMGEFVSGNYFRVFGLSPNAGRLFLDTDDVAAAPMTAVMSYATWQRDYAGDAHIVGSTFWVNTKAVTIVGIAPDGFYGDRLASAPPDFYLPIESMPVIANVSYVHAPAMLWLYVIGRVKPGVSLPALQAKISAIVRQTVATFPQFAGVGGRALLDKVHVVLTPGGAGIQSLQHEYASHLHLLMWVSGLVVLIVCANLANLLLVRGMGRRTEMSVRSALGARRSRIVRQLLTETMMLACLGGAMGLVLTYAGTRMLLALAFPGVTTVPIHASPSLAVVGFAFAVSLVTGVLFGVAPAWSAAQAQPADALRSGGRSTAPGASLVQRSLVVLQAAVSLVLLVGAGLFSQSLSKLEDTDMKIQTANRYVVHINPQAAGYSQRQLEALYRTMEDRFHALPGVTKVGISTYTPMEDDNWSNDVQVEGQPNLNVLASFVKANADYFDSVGTRVVTGRGIGPQDTSGAMPVAVVNEAFVKELFKGRNPIGAHFGGAGDGEHRDFEIVGVVENSAYENVREKDKMMFFVPIMQRPLGTKDPIEEDESLYAGAMVIETSRPMDGIEMLARKALAGINPNLTIVKFQTFDAQVADRFSEERMIARLTQLFGGLALLLATIGLYGVTSYVVAGRTAEIGIRMALGAGRSSVVAMVMRGAILQAAIGLAIGIPVALLCVRFVKSELYETSGVNPIVLGGAVTTLALAACFAALLPARRAASTDPVQALRTD